MAKSRKSSSLVNLQNQLLLQVDGESEKGHSLKWEVMRNVCDTTLKLLQSLAKYSLEDSLIPLESIRLEFVGFHPGSAIPELRLADPPNLLFPVDDYYGVLNSDFNFVVSKIDKGNFQAIADKYPLPEVKNEIITSVFNFTNSTGTSPLKIVRKIGKSYQPIARIRKMSIDVREKLYVKDLKTVELVTPEEYDAIAKVKVKRTPKGRISKSKMHLYTEKEAAVSLNFDSIETEKRIYVLRGMFPFTVIDTGKNSVLIECPMLDIYAFGESLDEAKSELFTQFDYTFQRLNQVEDSKLSDHLRRAKSYVNLIVESVKNI